MPTAPQNVGSNPQAVKLLLAGVAIVLAAQLCSAIPIAAAIALIAWGTSLCVAHSGRLLLVAAAVYAPLAVLAVTAQVDLAMRASLPWAILAGLDAAVAITLLYSLARQTGQQLVRG